MCWVWGMAQSVNTKIWANRERREGCWLALTLLLSGSGVFVFRAQPMAEGHTWWLVEKGKSKGWICSSAHASPYSGKAGQDILVFWGRNRFEWIKLSHLYFSSRNMQNLSWFGFCGHHSHGLFLFRAGSSSSTPLSLCVVSVLDLHPSLWNTQLSSWGAETKSLFLTFITSHTS